MVPNALIVVSGPCDLQIDDCCPINVRRLQSPKTADKNNTEYIAKINTDIDRYFKVEADWMWQELRDAIKRECNIDIDEIVKCKDDE